MALTNAARDLIAQALIGEAFTSFANANARIGVGDSSAAFAASSSVDGWACSSCCCCSACFLRRSARALALAARSALKPLHAAPPRW